MQKKGYKKHYTNAIIQIINITILFILLFISYSDWDAGCLDKNWAGKLSILSLVILVYQLCILYIKQKNILDFEFMFIIFSHIFLFGQIYLLALGLGNEIFYNVISRYPDGLIFKAGLFSICYIHSIFIGLTYKSNVRRNVKGFINNLENTELKMLMFKTGVFLLIISFPFELYVDINKAIIIQSTSTYTGSVDTSGISTDLAILFIPSLLLIICSGYLGKKKNKYVLWFAISYLVGVMILTGDRRYYFTGILALVLGFLKFNRTKIRIFDFIKYGLLGAILLNILSIIRNIRGGSLVNILEFFRIYGHEIVNNNPLFETLNEFGATILSVAFPLKYFPDIFPYQYGFSFFGSIPSLLPIGWLFKEFFNKVSITTSYINPIEGYHVGGSLPGDLYANFGWWGILVAIIFGVLLSKIFVITNDNNSFEIARYYAAFYILINLVRATFLEVFRSTLIITIVPLFVILIFKNHINRNAKFKK